MAILVVVAYGGNVVGGDACGERSNISGDCSDVNGVGSDDNDIDVDESDTDDDSGSGNF